MLYIVYVYPPSLSIPAEQHVSRPGLSFVTLLLTIMLCGARKLLFSAALTASVNKGQQSRQAIIAYESTSESIKGCSCLPYKSYFHKHLAHETVQSRAFNVLATLFLQSMLYWQLATFSHSCPSTYTCLTRSLNSTFASMTSF